MPAERAFYYVRVIQIPSPRWTAYDQKRYGIKMSDNVPMTVTDRAYTSPIWYSPSTRMTRAERFTKRTFTLPLLARSLGAVVLRLPVLVMALVRPSVPRALREQVMLGVNSVNGCRYCSWAHTGRALAHGVNLDELAYLLDTGTFGNVGRA